ncbi:MAG: tetratricopeptide repeat protein [Planctomycetaceae bacterium]
MAEDQKKKFAAESFKKGTEAMAKQNWDYAIQMTGQAVKLDPGNLLFRQTLRGCERRKYPKGTGAKMASMRLMGVKGSIKKSRMTKNWTQLDQSAEEGLELVPWDAELNADCGEATSNLGFTDVAVQCYRWAVESDPNNKALLKSLGLLLEQKGEFVEAIKYWDRAFKLDPLDMEARSKITQLNASSVIRDGDFTEEDGSKKERSIEDIRKTIGKQTAQGTAADGPGQSEEADLQRLVRKDPDNKDGFLKLADYYRRGGKLEDAGAMYQKALELSGGDPNIREQLEDVELDLMRKNVDLAKANAAKKPGDEEAEAQAKAQATELIKREIEAYRSRVERHPNDLKMKFTLGERFYKLKMYSQAIPLFQAAVQDNRMEGQALLLLAKCFINDKKGILARKQLEKAVPKLNVVEHRESFLEAHYYLGRLCEEAKDSDKAGEHYGEVLAVDYEYKDALKRLEGLS